MDLVTLGLGVGGIVVTPLGVAVSAAIKKASTNEKRLTTLEANYTNLDDKLTDVSGKLDRLIEKFL